MTKEITSVRCGKRLRRKVLDKYKVWRPRLISVYSSAHGLPPTLGPSLPEHKRLPPVNAVCDVRFHVCTYTYMLPTPVFSPACPQKIVFELRGSSGYSLLLSPTDSSQGSLKNCQADSSSLCGWAPRLPRL